MLPLFSHLNCVDDAAGHDREFPSDRAHSQFELGHVWCIGQHVGETVWASCVHKTKKESLRRAENAFIFFKIRRWQAIKTWFSELKRERGHTSLFFGVIKKVVWTYGAASSKSVQFGSGLVLKNICKKDLKRYQLNFKKNLNMGCTWSRCCFGTSGLSCFPKYMSEEMAFVSPNFIWASPVSTTGAGFLLVEGLQAQELTLIIIKTKNRVVFVYFKFPHSSLSHVLFVWHLKTQTHSLNSFPLFGEIFVFIWME